MVVDLGAVRDVTTVRLTWSSGRRRPTRIETSMDGLAYQPVMVAETSRPDRVNEVPVNMSTRYVAVVVTGWRPGTAELVEVAVAGE
jgi:hypothetical protein